MIPGTPAPPVWLLATPRSGSSFLCELLNHSGLFRDHTGDGRAFGEWLWREDCREVFVRHPWPHLKVMPQEYRRVCPTLDNRAEVERRLRGVRFIRLRRRDTVAQAASLYFAWHTGVYHLDDPEALAGYLGQDIPWNRELVLSVYREVCSWQGVWDAFLAGAAALEVTYEELRQEVAVLLRVADYLGLALSREQVAAAAGRVSLLRMGRPEVARYRAELREALAAVGEAA